MFTAEVTSARATFFKIPIDLLKERIASYPRLKAFLKKRIFNLTSEFAMRKLQLIQNLKDKRLEREFTNTRNRDAENDKF
jgi:hypothetical protein